MNRELKFRAWDKVENKMLFDADPFAVHVSGSNEPLLAETHKNVNCIFEQYTGLKDKNGKEIYEGDVVMARWYRAKNARLGTKGEIKFNDGWFYIHDDPDGQDRLGVPIHNCYDVVIIGNIHENSELLEEL